MSGGFGGCRRRGAPGTIGHKLVELGLVLGLAEPLEEIEEFLLLVFETAQRLGLVVVEGAVAARFEAVSGGAHPMLALLFPLLGGFLPALGAAMLPATHASTPDHIGQ